MKNFTFFLGGDDVEMRRIAEIARYADYEVRDAGLGWGAKASAYGTDVFQAVIDSGGIPVLVELEVDCEVPDGAAVVDHHNDRSGEPASLLQILELLGMEPTRKDQLIAANDVGYIPAMLAIGATEAEIASIRTQERSISGVTPEMEAEVERAIAIADAEAVAAAGGLVVIRMSHSKTATVSDRLYKSWKDGEKLIVLSDDGEVNFFGDGALCADLQRNFEGWSGGAGLGQKGRQGFWGGYPDHEEVLAFVRERIA